MFIADTGEIQLWACKRMEVGPGAPLDFSKLRKMNEDAKKKEEADKRKLIQKFEIKQETDMEKSLKSDWEEKLRARLSSWHHRCTHTSEILDLLESDYQQWRHGVAKRLGVDAGGFGWSSILINLQWQMLKLPECFTGILP